MSLVPLLSGEGEQCGELLGELRASDRGRLPGQLTDAHETE